MPGQPKISFLGGRFLKYVVGCGVVVAPQKSTPRSNGVSVKVSIAANWKVHFSLGFIINLLANHEGLRHFLYPSQKGAQVLVHIGPMGQFQPKRKSLLCLSRSKLSLYEKRQDKDLLPWTKMNKHKATNLKCTRPQGVTCKVMWL